MVKKYDWRSDEASLYRPHYQSKEWKALRTRVIVRDLGICKACGCICQTGRLGNPRLATVDHIIPHKGDMGLFFDEANCQLLCATCHSGAKQSEEKTGFSRAVDEFGYPVDVRHPANVADASVRKK